MTKLLFSLSACALREFSRINLCRVMTIAERSCHRIDSPSAGKLPGLRSSAHAAVNLFTPQTTGAITKSVVKNDRRLLVVFTVFLPQVSGIPKLFLLI